jgi:predicted DCC family thiol-disulfide oxidoreductase YuxK
MTNARLTLFYDGLCPLCSREIAHYRRRMPRGAADFIDIADPTFDAANHGLDHRQVQRIMHVKVGQELHLGLDAFIAIWDAIPAYQLLGRFAKLPGVHAVLRLGYAVFARVRPWLPRRRKHSCETGTCRH